MFEARNLSLTVGIKELLVETSFRIGDKDKVGLVGLNGTGKSTLMRLIAGTQSEQTLSVSGQMLKSSDTTIGYLPQEISFEDDLEKTALQYAIRANERLYDLSLAIDTMQHELALPDQDHEGDEYHDLIHRFTDATHEFERLGGYKMQSDAEKVLSGLGFSEADFHKKVKDFSGGWQMRLLITRLLLQNPTLLLLDEPTNHLDIDSLRWLENYLLGYEHSFLIVSHDRFFLDKLTTKTFEITLRRVTEYKGNYSFYEKAKAERYEQLAAKYENDQKKIAHLNEFVERFRYKATKARQAQSRLRQMQKLQAELEAPEEDLSQISFRFPKAMPSGKTVLTMKNLRKSYPLPDGSKKEVLRGIDTEVQRGERIAIVGSNGAGKTTFCKILAGETDFGGEMALGHNVSLSYFSQHQTERLNPDRTILEEMNESAPDSAARMKVRDILGCFLFSGEAVEKKIRVLSGGEKSRVALAKILLLSSNLLILDEPTNHLDIRSKEMLIEALENYDGTLLIVSHDRYFLDSLVGKVYEIKNGGLREYLGSYAEFMEKWEKSLEEEKKLQQEREAEQKRKAAQKVELAKKPAPKTNQKELTKLERKIEELEAKKSNYEAQMAEPDFYADEKNSQKTLGEYERVTAELEKLYESWEAAAS